jgi:2-amino-4-hydroxy-6-hydroxymethyldihydropteridine diphosphokinase
MIFLGLGGNMPSERFGPPRATLEAALSALKGHGVQICRRSRWYRSQPLPDDGQPWYVNGVSEIATTLPPGALLTLLLEIERTCGRERRKRWAPRTIDLDLLAYHEVSNWVCRAPAVPVLPHPRLHERAFVLAPLAELAPGWRHPVLGRTVEAMLEALPAGQYVAPLEPTPEGGSPGPVAGAAPAR